MEPQGLMISLQDSRLGFNPILGMEILMCFESNLIPELILALEGMVDMLPRLFVLQFLPQLQKNVLFAHPAFLTLRSSI